MPKTGNDIQRKRVRSTFRVGQHSLSFSVIGNSAESQSAFEPYILKSGISLAANLCGAFEESDLLSYGYQQAQVMVDSPVLTIPIDESDESAIEILYHHTFIGHGDSTVLHVILPNLNAAAVFFMNKDLRLVVTDHFNDVRFHPMLWLVWSYLHKRSLTGAYQRPYAYFHDRKVNVLYFQHSRFRFCNAFDTASVQDAIYFLLYVWKLLALDTEKDELHIAGDVPKHKWLTDNLHRYSQKVYYINPAAEFNRAPIINIERITFDLITLFLKGK